MGAAGHLGRPWTYLAIPIFLWASCRQKLVWELGRRIIPSPRTLWLSSQSPRPAAGNQIGSALPKDLGAVCVVISCPSPLTFSFWQLESSLSTRSLSCLAHSFTWAQLHCRLPSFFLVSFRISGLETPSEEGRVLFCNPPLERAAP